MHTSTERSDVLAHVATNLRRLRRQAGLSQAALAEASGISRRMIISLEGGSANISLSSLDKIAEALGVTFVDLVAAPGGDEGRINAVAWRGEHPASRAVLLGSTPARHEVQAWSWSLGPGERYQAEPDPQGWHEMIVVTEGRLLLELEDGPITVAAGDHAIFSSAQQYAYVNNSDGVTRFVRNVVS